MRGSKVVTFEQWQADRQASGMYRCINGQVCYPALSLDCIKCYDADMTEMVNKVSKGGK